MNHFVVLRSDQLPRTVGELNAYVDRCDTDAASPTLPVFNIDGFQAAINYLCQAKNIKGEWAAGDQWLDAGDQWLDAGDQWLDGLLGISGWMLGISGWMLGISGWMGCWGSVLTYVEIIDRMAMASSME